MGTSPDLTGAKNHQETCPVGENAPDLAKNIAKCDRDEGSAAERWQSAIQAYLEWLPLRAGPGSMGVVEDFSLTQIIEWGDLATLVVFDTRITDRSKEPTTGSRESLYRYYLPFVYEAFSLNLFAHYFTDFLPFVRLSIANTDVDQYSESPLKENITAIADDIRAEIMNPEYSLIGENIEILREAFQNSKAAGKPWQIFGAPVSTYS